MMKPVKAFLYQDHTAHIAVHMAAMQDPKIQSLLKNNPQAPQLQLAMMAHINEHLGFQYRIEIEQQLGMTLPPQYDESGEEQNMNPEVEARLAPMLAQAATQLLQQNKSQAQQQQAQQQAQDPIVQMQQQELQIKQAEQQRKTQKDAVDAQLKMAQIDVEKQRIQTQAKLEGAKALMNQSAQKKTLLVNSGLDLLKNYTNRKHEETKQQKELFAKGLDNAHKHAAGQNRPEPKIKSEEKGD